MHIAIMLFAAQQSFAQIGYQVSLLNSATGEPRAGETVDVTITLTDNEGTVIYHGTQKETTNDFGILSLSVGNAKTFDKVDWNKLPLFISAYVDEALIGKVQVLTVPVAEYAIRTGYLTKEILSSKSWESNNAEDDIIFNFSNSGTGTWHRKKDVDEDPSKGSGTFTYTILGNELIIYNDQYDAERLLYIKDKNILIDDNRRIFR